MRTTILVLGLTFFATHASAAEVLDSEAAAQARLLTEQANAKQRSADANRAEKQAKTKQAAQEVMGLTRDATLRGMFDASGTPIVLETRTSEGTESYPVPRGPRQHARADRTHTVTLGPKGLVETTVSVYRGRREMQEKISTRTVKTKGIFPLFARRLKPSEYPELFTPGAATSKVKRWLAARTGAKKK